MTEPFEPVNTPEDTASFVQNRWGYFREHADELIDLAIAAGLSMGALPTAYVPIAVDFDVDFPPEWGTFAQPTAPTPPTFLDVNLTAPPAPDIGNIAIPDPGPAPTEPDVDQYLQFQLPASEPVAPTPPSTLDDDVVLDDVTIPVYVEPTLPTMDELYAIVMPEPLPLELPTFDAERPVFAFDTPENTFNFDNEEYDSALLQQLRDKISEICTGGTGLPPSVENSLFEQARAREVRANDALRSSVEDEFAARGWSEPSGVHAARLKEVDQDLANKSSSLSRDIFIQRYKEELEQLRYAITQGAALEGQLIQQQIAFNDRMLRAQQITVEVAISLYNARINQYNSAVQAYGIDSQVYRDRVQGELAKVELYKAQVEAQQVVGEVNKTLVEAYTEQVRAVVALAELYKTRLDAARAQLEINGQRLEAKRVQVQTYAARVSAYGEEWDGYKAQVEGRLGAMRAGETLVQLYGQRVEAYSTKANAAFAGARLLFDREDLKVKQFLGQLDSLRAQLALATANNDNRARTFDAQARVYESQGRMVESEATVKTQVTVAKGNIAEAKANVQLRAIDAQVNQTIKLLEVNQEARKSKGAILAQLAASVLSGFNFGASLNASSSFGYSKSVGVNYSAGGPPITFAIGGI
jgi:hypothetical protein